MNSPSFSLKRVFAGAAAVVVFSTALSSFKILDETERGLDYQFGKMATVDASQLRSQGLSFKLPWTSVTKVGVDLQHRDYENVVTYTKDNQVITAKLAVMFKIPQDHIVNIYKNNPDWESKLERTILDATKAALGKQEAQNVSQNREAIMKEVTQEAKDKVGALLGLEIVAVQLPNYDFDDEFEKAVSSAANAKAELNRKQTELEQQKVEAQKTIVNADAASTAAKKTADGASYATQINAEAQAKGFERISNAIGREHMNTYLLTQKWNGSVPTVSGGSGTILDMRQIAPIIKP